MNFREEMYTEEDMTLEYRQGKRAGLELALSIVEDYLADLKQDKRIDAMLWVDVARQFIDEEIAMYIVGDEE